METLLFNVFQPGVVRLLGDSPHMVIYERDRSKYPALAADTTHYCPRFKLFAITLSRFLEFNILQRSSMQLVLDSKQNPTTV